MATEKWFPECEDDKPTDSDRKRGWNHFDDWCKENKVKGSTRVKCWSCWKAAQGWDARGQDW